MIEIRCYYDNIFFNITISQNDTLLNLKKNIISNLLSNGIVTNESNISILYGYPTQTINNNEFDNLSLLDLSIFDKDSISIKLINPISTKKEEKNQINGHNNKNGNGNIIDYSKYSIKKKDIPADNSCLFNAINFAINQNINSPDVIRGIITSEIKSNPAQYTSAILGKSPEEYCKWILNKETWGAVLNWQY